MGGGDSVSSFCTATCNATLGLRGLLRVVELHKGSRVYEIFALALLHTFTDEAGDDDDQEQPASASAHSDTDDRAGVVGFGRSLWR